MVVTHLSTVLGVPEDVLSHVLFTLLLVSLVLAAPTLAFLAVHYLVYPSLAVAERVKTYLQVFLFWFEDEVVGIFFRLFHRDEPEIKKKRLSKKDRRAALAAGSGSSKTDPLPLTARTRASASALAAAARSARAAASAGGSCGRTYRSIGPGGLRSPRRGLNFYSESEGSARKM